MHSMLTMQDSASITRNKSVVFTELDGEVIILDTGSGKYYEMDSIGSRIWMLLECNPSLMDLQKILTAEFDVDDQTCFKDISDFIGNLAELGLISETCDENAAQ